MGTPFLGEIRIFSFNFPPKNWAFCDGQLLPIAQNQALFSLMGTTYGGNGQTNFALPNLRGQAPMHRGSQLTQGQTGGVLQVTLIPSQIPTHTHFTTGSTEDGDVPIGAGGVLAASGTTPVYGPALSLTTLHPASVTTAGNSTAHDNTQPSLVLNFCVALQGIFPSQN